MVTCANETAELRNTRRAKQRATIEVSPIAPNAILKAYTFCPPCNRLRLLDQACVRQHRSHVRVILLELLCEGRARLEVAGPVVPVEIGLPVGRLSDLAKSLLPIRDLSNGQSLGTHH